MTNKTTLRIPGKDAYSYIEVVLEDATPEEAKNEYDSFKDAFLSEETSLPQKEFNVWIDTYISTGKPGSVEEWELMSKTQKVVVNEIKKYLTRNVK